MSGLFYFSGKITDKTLCDMHIVLVDRADWRKQLYPLTLTRPVADLRVGIVTIAEKWGKWMNGDYSFLTEEYLQDKFQLGATGSKVTSENILIVRADVLPDESLCEQASALRVGEGMVDDLGFLMLRVDQGGFAQVCGAINEKNSLENLFELRKYPNSFNKIRFPEDIFRLNGQELAKDFDLLTKGRTSAALSSSNRVLGERIFVEEGVKAECSIFNSIEGPIYLGRNSEVWEGSMIRGAFALGEASHVKMGARIYPDVTVGPHSRVGGELSNSVIWGYSSKGHDGYMGCAVIGEWCNWGADTNNSNLKNNYKNVKLFDYAERRYRDTGLQFCGMIMGDHSKSAINTAFNTGSVVGVGCNVFGGGFPPVFVPDFAWGGSEGFVLHRLDRMQETAALVYARRNRTFDQTERALLSHVFELTARYRKFS